MRGGGEPGGGAHLVARDAADTKAARRAMLALAAHSGVCAIAALGPSGCGLPGLLVASKAYSRQEPLLGSALLLSAAAWASC